jgi:hypothetical protein
MGLTQMKQKAPVQSYFLMFAWLGLLITIALLLLAPLHSPWPKVLEATLYLLCFLLLGTYPPLRCLFTAIPRSQRWAVLSLAGILLVAQIKDRPQQTFPFFPWNMYHGRFREPPQYLEYIGVCADGREVFIPMARVFSSQHRTAYWRLQNLWKEMEAAKDESKRQQHADQFRLLLMAMVARFNDQHPGTDIMSVRVIQCSMPRPAPGLKLEVTRHLYKEYPLS